ncbi:ferrous iron transport protein B [Caproiciproducens galactitolivorans]|uniref:Ferrous iron transport protein B n=1 Tax=Caproiciproducens galactitolivorans TaxID=642589 RepID=A0A4Z0YBE6_9FIRM|nr:ferrous iron transport protein B [Caproiciproducens galactitolivorans]QEY35526.1 ferrous iron transport protein B [Caproiciproducens galactitolivorans]TGJ77248.1 ferrous iron transport protein B [Caproiciproducens galactitolivorans]
MGLSGDSTGTGVLKCCDGILQIEKDSEEDRVIALAGNPNVGKSTVFNQLTGLNQHTGNWPGKTVANAQGKYYYGGKNYILVDIPGTYSLMANSEEEEIARDFICFGEPDATVVVADATCLERNLNLVLQTMEISKNVVLCVNLLDEAKRKKIRIRLDVVSEKLGIPVVGTSARSGKGLNSLMEAVSALTSQKSEPHPLVITYGEEIEKAVSILEPAVQKALQGKLNSRWVALKLLDGDSGILNALKKHLQYDILANREITECLEKAWESLDESGIPREMFRDKIVTKIVQTCEEIGRSAVVYERQEYAARDRKIDKILTSKLTGIPIMLLLLCGIFWLTITGANYPSELIANGLFWVEDRLSQIFTAANAPLWVKGLLIDGCYRTLAWVVSVMLPPMAIFFPLFTLLEDLGYLPRVAFNLDNFFRKACAHGKQSLSMCMGFGCNACGVIGCRIIDSPRERLIAILTNNFVPCNGRFPTLIAVITMFFAGGAAGTFQSLVSTLMLTMVIVLGVVMTLLISKLLSKTILKGLPSSFHLELPPYRKPQIGKVIVRSIFDRTLFVLRRAAAVAAPAGLVIWLMANLKAGDSSILALCADFLDPFARLIGLDGYILMAFILGFPANEIVVPIIIMSYMATGALTDYESLAQLHTLLIDHGWTWLTAVCVMLFSLMHWPCGTTCLTIKKETQSMKWTLLAFALPTVTGLVVCFCVANTARFFGLA